jgi:hypothetical protein
MTRHATPLDISAMPEVARLAEEVARTGQARVLRTDDQDVAILSPARPAPRRRRRKPVTQADIDAAMAASWVGLVDAEQLKRDLDAARSDNRPPIVL